MMKRLFCSKPLLAILLLAVSFTGVYAAERRCDDLGDVCSCSEPFNTNGFSLTSFDDPGGSGKYWVNPQDSATKQCGQWGGYGWYSDNDLQVINNAVVPTGSTVTTVWRNNVKDGVSGLAGVTPKDAIRKICIRHYVRFSSDYDAFGENGCRANKQMYFTYRSGGNIVSHTQMSNGGNGGTGGISIFARNWSALPATTSPANSIWIPEVEAGGGADTADCKGVWCRQEMCLSGTDVKNGRGITVSGYTQVVHSDKRTTYGPHYIGDVLSGGTLTAPDVILGYRESCTNGYKDFSHAMQAEWTSDPGAETWIGPAAEFEGRKSPPKAPVLRSR